MAEKFQTLNRPMMFRNCKKTKDFWKKRSNKVRTTTHDFINVRAHIVCFKELGLAAPG